MVRTEYPNHLGINKLHDVSGIRAVSEQLVGFFQFNSSYRVPPPPKCLTLVVVTVRSCGIDDWQGWVLEVGDCALWE